VELLIAACFQIRTATGPTNVRRESLLDLDVDELLREII